MKDLTDRISALSPEQRALLEARMKKKGLQAPAVSRSITRRPPALAELCPPSVDQERLWFIEQLQEGSAAYNIFAASRIEGPLDVRVLERVVNELVRRHEALRTTFADIDGAPMQRIAPAREISLVPVDLTHLPRDEREREARRITTEDFSSPFDLAAGPLMRFGLLRLGPDEHVMHINMHHIISDRWSFSIFEQELGALYQAFAEGRPSPLAEPQVQFGDYAVWQRERMQGEAYQKQLAYWREKLSGVPPVLEVATDRPRPPIQNFHGGHVQIHYSKQLMDALRALGQSEGATMNMTMMAAYRALLHRYTGETDFSIAASIANRDRPETQMLFGYLLNLLVLRTDVSGDPSFRELLRRERETALGAYANQDVPFGKLVQELKPKQDPGRNPLVQVAFIYLDFPEMTSMEFLGLKATHLDIDNEASRFDLSITLSETSEGLVGVIEYQTALYERTRIERMARHFEVLLEAIVADPHRPLSALALLTEEEREQILHAWSAARGELESNAFVHEMFEAQAAARPDGIALIFNDAQLTYAELDARAERLARRLTSFGVGPEARVGLCVTRSIEMVVGILGILKAGGAYVPLDPAHPRARLAYITEDARLAALLTEENSAAELPSLSCPVIRLDASESSLDGTGVETQTGADARTRLAPENAVYVIYTSGSTGKPKGVVVSQRALATRVTAMRELFDLRPEDRQWQFLSPAFDASAQEIFPALAAGATLVISPHLHEVLTGESLREAAHAGASIWAMPASYWHALVDEMSEAKTRLPESLRLLTVGGEAPAPGKLAAFRNLVSHPLRLLNVYGPTEATILATAYEIDLGDDAARERIPIGRPIVGARLYILDRAGQLIPAGIPGELCLGGAGLARGYLSRTGLTAERFVPDPFSGDAGARLYRTGDLARFLPDGQIEFLGRTDEQVKVRGFRIEMGEIEATLASHPAVGQVIVVAREDAGTAKRLVAYLTFSTARGVEQPPAAAEMREHLRQRLPDYMIPSAFVTLDEFPLTPTGKIDRRALPAPDEARGREAAYVAPRTATEETVAALFARVLNLKQVGADDNFFESGGDSLLATQLASQVRKTFELELPLRDLFAHPTVAGLALHVEELLIEQMENISEEEAQQLLDGDA